MNQYTTSRLIAQLVFGVDTTIALGTYLVLSLLFGLEFSWTYLLLALAFVYLPDADFLWFMLLPKRLRRWGHWWFGLHHPLLFLPLVGLVTWFISASLLPPLEATFLTTLALVCVLGHFIHDSTNPGLHWFSPISRDWRVSFDPLRWLHIRTTRHGLHVLSPAEVTERYANTRRQSEGSGLHNEVATRLEPVTKAQLATFTLTLVGLLLGF